MKTLTYALVGGLIAVVLAAAYAVGYVHATEEAADVVEHHSQYMFTDDDMTRVATRSAERISAAYGDGADAGEAMGVNVERVRVTACLSERWTEYSFCSKKFYRELRR